MLHSKAIINHLKKEISMRLNLTSYRNIITPILLIQTIEMLATYFFINKRNQSAGTACLLLSFITYFINKPLRQEALLNGPLVMRDLSKERLIQHSLFHKVSIICRETSLLMLKNKAPTTRMLLIFFLNHTCFYKLKKAMNPDHLLTPPHSNEQKREYDQVKKYYHVFLEQSKFITLIDIVLCFQYATKFDEHFRQRPRILPSPF